MSRLIAVWSSLVGKASSKAPVSAGAVPANGLISNNTSTGIVGNVANDYVTGNV